MASGTRRRRGTQETVVIGRWLVVLAMLALLALFALISVMPPV